LINEYVLVDSDSVAGV